MKDNDLKTKLYRMFILGTDGGGYLSLLDKGLGGVIFFSSDIKTPEQFKTLISDIKKKSSSPVLLSIDQEGGRVERTENIHGGKKYLSARYAYQKGLDFLKTQTECIAHELKSYGINLNFAPCIDVNTNPNNPIIGERSFSSNPDEVIEAERVVSRTYMDNGIIPCLKHFPGHGDVDTDSHLALPKIDLSLEEMEKTHIKPFKYAVNNAKMVMVAHMHCTCFEKTPIPTSLSAKTIDYLRNNLKYDGVIISDDMIMKGVSGFGDVEACIMGIKAGLNMFIYRNSNRDTLNMIEKVYETASNDSELRKNIEKSYEKISSLLTVVS